MASTRSEPALGSTLEFMRLLWALDHVLHKRSKWMARRFGLTGPQRFALRVIGREPDLSAGRLAGILKVHPSTLTGILQRVERRGFLMRRVDQGDRRRVRLELTPSGRAVTASSGGSIEDLVAGVLRRASPGKLAATTGVLKAMVYALESDAAPVRPRRRVQV
ncbi:MAG TPA: MarR family transcriptional regulator [Vicinamibacterales bacterium]